MYRLHGNDETGRVVSTATRITDGVQFPFDPANTDYQTFKRDLTEGVELQDAEGNVMTSDQVTAFLGTLP